MSGIKENNRFQSSVFPDLGQLSLAALELLTHPAKYQTPQGVGIQVVQGEGKFGEEFDLSWPDLNQDRLIFTGIYQLLRDQATCSDQQFQQVLLPVIREQLAQTTIFSLLADPEVILTPAHQANGLNSAEHIIRVALALQTDALSAEHKLLMRMFVLHHDLGKALSAGISEVKTRAALADQRYEGVRNKQGELKNSFPDHQLLSALAFETLYLNNQLLSQADRQLLTFLIAHHHQFQDFVSGKVDWHQLPGDQVMQEKLMVYLCLFAHADIAATPAHHKYWSANAAWMIQTLPDLKQLPADLRAQVAITTAHQLRG